jgi:hypothetical protein
MDNIWFNMGTIFKMRGNTREVSPKNILPRKKNILSLIGYSPK